LFVGNAGTAARFLAAMVCLGEGVYRLHGVPRMHERPQAALFVALRGLGHRVESEQGNDKLPVRIWGGRPSSYSRSIGDLAPKYREQLTGERMPSCKVSIEESSQFASALLLCSKAGGWKVEVTGENAEESPYVAMTLKLIEAFPHRGGRFRIEPDASSGSYFWAAGEIAEPAEFMEYSQQFGVEVTTKIYNRLTVAAWPSSGWQVDEGFHDFLMFGHHFHTLREIKKSGKTLNPEMVAAIEHPKREISRISDLGDSIMTAIVLAPFESEPCKFTDLGRLRVQECERVVALRTELCKCGAKVIEDGDTLTVYPSQLHGAEIETYNDHRMAMCFAILGLKVPGIKIKNPACVKKTFPNFFQKLAAAPPHGLGATILDASGRKLAHEDLFAD
jgi:3-phosphoshikimate 1-carboxyvinyltransferase